MKMTNYAQEKRKTEPLVHADGGTLLIDMFVPYLTYLLRTTEMLILKRDEVKRMLWKR